MTRCVLAEEPVRSRLMPNCCYPEEYGEMFSARKGSRHSRRYVKRGLRGSEAKLADRVTELGVDGATVLDVGGGVGALHLELLHRGAASAVNVELTDEWKTEAGRLANRAGLGDRTEVIIGDLVDEGDELPSSDIVLLHRVACCYPDWQGMIDAAAGRSRRVFGFTIPRSTWPSRRFTAIGNTFLRWRGRSFQVFIHPVDQMLARLADHGFAVTSDDHDLVWRTLVLQRS